MNGLQDEPWPGGPRRIDDNAAAEVVRKTLEENLGMPRALEHALNGPRDRLCAVDEPPYLAGLLLAAAPERDLQALGGPLLRGQGARHRRPLHVPAATYMNPFFSGHTGGHVFCCVGDLQWH